MNSKPVNKITKWLASLDTEQQAAVTKFVDHFNFMLQYIPDPNLVINCVTEANFDAQKAIGNFSPTFAITAKIPIDSISNLVFINDDEFITTEWRKTYQLNIGTGIYIFNVKTNQWTFFMQYPSKFDSLYHTICYNGKTKRLYIAGCCDEQSVLHIVNMETKQWKMNYLSADIIATWNQFPALFIIDGRLHIMGGIENKHHYIWSDEARELVRLSKQGQEQYLVQGQMKVIGVESRNMVLSLGAEDFEHSIVVDDGDAAHEVVQELYKYDLSITEDQRKWELFDEVKIPKPLFAFGYVYTRDQRYVVIIGGRERTMAGGRTGRNNDTVYILDLNEMRFYKSLVETPWTRLNGYVSNCHCALYEQPANEMLIVGYMRLNIVFPKELCQIIYPYCTREVVHVIPGGFTYNHWMCHLDDLVNDKIPI